MNWIGRDRMALHWVHDKLDGNAVVFERVVEVVRLSYWGYRITRRAGMGVGVVTCAA